MMLGALCLLLLSLWVVTPATAAKPQADSTVGEPDTRSAMSRAHVQEILTYHNKVRHDVGVGPLRWSPRLAAYAQRWADELASTTCRMQHRARPRFGENLFIGTAGHYRAVHAAKAWEEEKPLYKGGALTKSNWKPAGHYTQMIWRNTERVGCGEAQCKGMLMVVCNYDPPGNYIGQKPY